MRLGTSRASSAFSTAIAMRGTLLYRRILTNLRRRMNFETRRLICSGVKHVFPMKDGRNRKAAKGRRDCRDLVAGWRFFSAEDGRSPMRAGRTARSKRPNTVMSAAAAIHRQVYAVLGLVIRLDKPGRPGDKSPHRPRQNPRRDGARPGPASAISERNLVVEILGRGRPRGAWRAGPHRRVLFR
jgi:hypothetical protein